MFLFAHFVIVFFHEAGFSQRYITGILFFIFGVVCHLEIVYIDDISFSDLQRI